MSALSVFLQFVDSHGVDFLSDATCLMISTVCSTAVQVKPWVTDNNLLHAIGIYIYY